MEMSQLVRSSVPERRLAYIVSEIPAKFHSTFRLIMESEFVEGMKGVFALGIDPVFPSDGFCITKIEF